jgi:hypothetical protein
MEKEHDLREKSSKDKGNMIRRQKEHDQRQEEATDRRVTGAEET